MPLEALEPAQSEDGEVEVRTVLVEDEEVLATEVEVSRGEAVLVFEDIRDQGAEVRDLFSIAKRSQAAELALANRLHTEPRLRQDAGGS